MSTTLAQRAKTEQGTTVRSSEDEVNLALRLLILNGGRYTLTAEQLAEDGIEINRESLKRWRNISFPRRYFELRKGLGRDVGEEIAGRAFERALQADEAEQRYIAEAVAKIDRVHPDALARNALALAQAKGINVEKSQLLRDRPTEIKETRGVEELVKALERLGVAKKVDAIDVEVVEEEDVE
jgi:hypothetical protein